MNTKQFVTLAVLTFSSGSHASSVYLGIETSDTHVFLGDESHTLTPTGPSIAFNYDLDDNWGVNFDYARLNTTKQIAEPVAIDFESESWGAGVSYYSERWSAYYQFSNYDDQQLTDDSGPAPSSNSETDSVTHSIGASYYWLLDGDWQISNSLGLHYSDWEQTLTEIHDEPEPPPMTVLDPGSATLLSASLGVNKALTLSEDSDLNVGFYVSWNEVLESDTDTSDVSNEPNRSNPPDRDQNRNNFVASGSESYGLLSAYIAVDFAQNWTVDLDTSVDFGIDDSSQSWRLSVGYQF
ncbi:hypothetical protein [Planctobacterium marinum]|uniref:Outer membrane protein beta-barrel domain-containing protein n=1 Tax=Planctobacterium marinum TaxID=1631968 RepID=A0AA48KPQ0_9ALTE|nr:hypothetical protein MACH26_12090 [Planctobacterium marinum]